MALRAAAVAALLALLFSGCQGQPASAPQDQVPVITDPRDTEYLFNGTPGEHIHDYWQGRDNIEVLDYESGDFSASCNGCTDGMTILSMRPPDGSIVPQGTAWVNITVDVQRDSATGAVELWVQTAEDDSPQRVGEVTPGVALNVNSTQARNDPPHYVLSLWAFEVRVAGSDVEYSGSLSLRAVAGRGLPLVPYPPHADRWGGQAELEVLDESQDVQVAYGLQYPTGGYQYTCYGGCPASHVPAVIPFDAKEVQVTLTFETGAIPAGLSLSYHGANTRTMTTLAPEGLTPGQQVYTIDLERGEADSPYAPRTLWEFDVFFPRENLVWVWEGTYTLTAVATK